ncbi:LamG domain-containing protein [bacterium]|nr:LamG domain-containing protein [bacterium]
MIKTLVSVLIVSLIVAYANTGLAKIQDKDIFFYFTFDEGKGDEAKDIGPDKHVATLNNDAKWTKDGKIKGGIQFSGNSYVEVVADVPEKDFTMALWINTKNPGVGVYSVLDQAAGAGGHDRHFYIQGGNICFRVWQGGGWCTSTNVSDGKWHHITLVTETGEGQTVYVDGKEVGTHAYDHSDFDWQKIVWVGFSNDAGQQYFDGIIDEPAYYNRPLEEKEVNEAMNYSVQAVSSEGKLATTWSNIKVNY